MLDFSKPTITRVDEAFVHDGKGGSRLVRPGDPVELLDPGNEFMLKWLGPGPYIISWIGEWRCGRRSLYLKTEKGGEPGDHEGRFKCV